MSFRKFKKKFKSQQSLKYVKIDGVNKELKDTTFLFEYNNLDKLEYLLKKNIVLKDGSN